MLVRRFAIVVAALASPALAGPLAPPAGPVAETGRFGPRTEINAQNTPGNGTSLFVITKPGSYYLAGNVVGVAGQSGIQIAANSVSLDLNGFELRGVAGSVHGIHATLSFDDVAIFNGSIREWGTDGIQMAFGSGGSIRDISASDNGNTGIRTPSYCTVIRCVALSNGANGIFLSSGSTLRSSSVFQNGEDGIRAGASTTVIGCVSNSNMDNGIEAGSTSVVSGCVAASNAVHGIRVGSYCLVTGNQCDFNSGSGIYMGSARNRVEANSITDSGMGIEAATAGNLIIRNSVTGSSPAYSIATGNFVGVIVNPPPSLAIPANPALGVGSTDPWANFSY